ncbi:hypothetical protein AC578_10194 [Pseudocercospora eumusae]|uniref:Uncharacterized protein n=1 Tax=Pseudocercospora eumusae TaxID=321146 RepID=A0A139HYL7_9PEZI|nr:hypothetical protein AC578_10194 [Pseudocercospora eumusae]
MTSKAFMLSALVALAQGAVIEDRQVLCTPLLPRVEGFDRLKTNLISSILPITQKVGNGDGGNINWGSAVLADASKQLSPPWTPRSPNNSAVVGIGGTLLSTLQGDTGLTLNPTTTITPVNGARSIDLYSLYLSCAVNLENGLGSVASACNVKITGTTRTGSTLTTTYSYTPDASTEATMDQVVFAGWLGMTNIKFEIVPGAGTLTTLTALFVDSVAYCTRAV